MAEKVQKSLISQELTPEVASEILNHCNGTLDAKIRGFLYCVMIGGKLPKEYSENKALNGRVKHCLDQIKRNTLHGFLEQKLKKPGTKLLLCIADRLGEEEQSETHEINDWEGFHFESIDELTEWCGKKGISKEIIKELCDKIDDDFMQGELSILVHGMQNGAIKIVYNIVGESQKDNNITDDYNEVFSVERVYPKLEGIIPSLVKMTSYTGDWNDSFLGLRGTAVEVNDLEIRGDLIIKKLQSQDKELFNLCYSFNDPDCTSKDRKFILNKINANDAFRSLILNALENVSWTKENLKILLENQPLDHRGRCPNFYIKLSIKDVDTIISGSLPCLHFTLDNESGDDVQLFIQSLQDSLGIDSEKLFFSDHCSGNRMHFSGKYTNDTIVLHIKNSYLLMKDTGKVQGKAIANDIVGTITIEQLYNFLTLYGWGKGSEKFNALEF